MKKTLVLADIYIRGDITKKKESEICRYWGYRQWYFANETS